MSIEIKPKKYEITFGKQSIEIAIPEMHELYRKLGSLLGKWEVVKPTRKYAKKASRETEDKVLKAVKDEKYGIGLKPLAEKVGIRYETGHINLVVTRLAGQGRVKKTRKGNKVVVFPVKPREGLPSTGPLSEKEQKMMEHVGEEFSMIDNQRREV